MYIKIILRRIGRYNQLNKQPLKNSRKKATYKTIKNCQFPN